MDLSLCTMFNEGMIEYSIQEYVTAIGAMIKHKKEGDSGSSQFIFNQLEIWARIGLNKAV